ncbi:peptidase Do [Anaerohalosphaera lusitana]|uniref:Peptidase Do n=1 Tax=Anaerohalosphaera lusitana TaxID=1936003 RepID=A0A1U9NHN8_9BACT|nr:PDZ domain-containing protein [Anaerohalosphaera lusitana]AQT67264.1 peptidase Do [Anaerohalosphaera lusitana]
MKLNHKVLTIIAALLLIQSTLLAQPNTSEDAAEGIEKSLLFLEITSSAYENMQPWKKATMSSSYGYACAVGPYEVLTTAWNVTDTAHIKARLHGRNEFVPATVKVVDYEIDLALLELDREEMDAPLTPVTFSNDYAKGASVSSHWLTAGGRHKTGRGYIDRADVYKAPASYTSMLNYIIGNTSNTDSRGRLYCLDEKPVGLACWSDGDSKETGVIPTQIIDRFLADARDGEYKGFGSVGFSITKLIDPAMRNYLDMPDGEDNGVYVNDVYTLGTGSDTLEQGDVILAINGLAMNAYGRYEHPTYGRIQMAQIFAETPVGDNIEFTLWRDGKKITLSAPAEKFTAQDMLVPYYEYGMQPEYFVTAGFVFQKLTRPYMQMWGDDFAGKITPHIYNYYRDTAFSPTEDRQDVIMLSFVLPHQVNLGYHDLRGKIVKSVNGRTIESMQDFVSAFQLNPDAQHDVIEFEQDNPTVVIPRDQAKTADMMIAQRFGVTQQQNVN